MRKASYILILTCICLTFASCSAAAKDNNSLYQPAPGYFDMEESNEKYSEIEQNEFIPTELVNSQAFSLKVDTAAYTNVLRYINQGEIPPAEAVRTEELLNYFSYESDMPESEEHPFSIIAKTAPYPFENGKYMAYIRVKTPDIDKSNLPPSNLTFLIDTSGSMMSYDKLPLLQQAFSLLVENLTEKDTISIVTYSGSSSILLDSENGSNKDKILSAINSLEAGGSTAGAQGIQQAYALAKKNYREESNNRVILASDGDFNVGISNVNDLKSFISEKRNEGIYLSVLGFGTGNIRDDIMETLAANGNGNYSYIDTLMTAQKVLVDEMGANLFVVANDVKAQLRFNKEAVKEFRLIGYENRKMSGEEFNDTNKDAGEIGAGTDIVVLAELKLFEDYSNGKLYDVCIRYKTTDKNEQKEISISSEIITEDEDSDFNFACSVAGFCELLRKSDYIGETTSKDVLRLAQANIGPDTKGYRKQFVDMVNKYMDIAK